MLTEDGFVNPVFEAELAAAINGACVTPRHAARPTPSGTRPLDDVA